MGFTKKFSSHLQKELGFSEEKRAVVTYGLETLLSTLIGFLGIVFFGYLCGLLLPVVIISSTAWLTRVFTGGAHCTSIGRCTTVSILIFIILAYCASNLTVSSWAIIIGFLIPLLIISEYAPLEVKEKPLSEEHKKKLKKKAYYFSVFLGFIVILLCFLNYGNISLYIAVGYLWQCLTVTPIGVNVITQLDGILKSIGKGGGQV